MESGVTTIKLTIASSQTLQNQVYDYLHEKITNGEIPPGERIVEQSISRETGISRSPIREAIRRLDSEGLVVVSPRGGVRVYRATTSDYKHLYECRLSLEPTAAYFAALRINDYQQQQLADLIEVMNLAAERKEIEQLKKLSGDFHRLILDVSGNPFLVKMMTQLNSLLTLYRNAVLNIPERVDDGNRDHNAIWLAIRNKEPEIAEKLMKEHIHQDYQIFISKHTDFEK